MWESLIHVYSDGAVRHCISDNTYYHNRLSEMPIYIKAAEY